MFDRDDEQPHGGIPMTTFVLVPGAWLGGWAWYTVAHRLRNAGHEALPVTLTGLGDRAALARPEVDLETHIADVVSLLTERNLTEVVLVGHSYAGLVVQSVADRIPERIAAVVYVDSGPMPDGWSMLDFFGPADAARMEGVVRDDGDGWLLPFPGVEHLGAPSATADFDDATRDLLTAKATPQPFGTYRQPVEVRRAFAGEFRRVAIVAGGFGMPVAKLREMIASGNGPFSGMAGSDWEFSQLETGHWPMLTAPDKLAVLLQDVAAHREPAPSAGGR
jgi:pimeloyl-ACP methyl ester carboxylesterase